MKPRIGAIAGFLLILLGAFTLWHPVFHGPAKQQTIDLEDQRATLETQRVITIPRYLGVLVVALGALLALDSWLPEQETRRRRKGAQGPRGGAKR